MFKFEFEGTCITDPFLDETGRFPVDPIEYYKLDLNTLIDIYEKYCNKEKIPCLDAWEYSFGSLTTDQSKWITEFSKIWEKAKGKV